jgi:putative photosynthetic complex assembly protein 2
MESWAAFAQPVGCVIAAWWMATALILRLDRLPSRTFPTSLACAAALAVAGLALVMWSADRPTTTGAYAAFAGTLAIWGFVELALLTGFVVGPLRGPCPPSRGFARFGYAVRAILHHELALLASGAAIVAAVWSGDNKAALWVFAVLWIMRLCAKLNLHFGVPNLGDELLPPRLRYLGTYFSRRPVTPLYPATVALAAFAAYPLWKTAVAHDATGHAGVEAVILATLLSLAILEHVMMVLPISQSRLWGSGAKDVSAANTPAASTGEERAS